MHDHCKLEQQYCQRRINKLFQPLCDSTGHCPVTEIGSHREGIGECTYVISGRLESFRLTGTMARRLGATAPGRPETPDCCRYRSSSQGPGSFFAHKKGREIPLPAGNKARWAEEAHLLLLVYSNRLMILSMTPKRTVSSASFSTKVPPASVCALKAARSPARSSLIR